jgi:hypothetical protein
VNGSSHKTRHYRQAQWRWEDKFHWWLLAVACRLPRIRERWLHCCQPVGTPFVCSWMLDTRSDRRAKYRVRRSSRKTSAIRN